MRYDKKRPPTNRGGRCAEPGVQLGWNMHLTLVIALTGNSGNGNNKLDMKLDLDLFLRYVLVPCQNRTSASFCNVAITPVWLFAFVPTRRPCTSSSVQSVLPSASVTVIATFVTLSTMHCGQPVSPQVVSSLAILAHDCDIFSSFGWIVLGLESIWFPPTNRGGDRGLYSSISVAVALRVCIPFFLRNANTMSTARTHRISFIHHPPYFLLAHQSEDSLAGPEEQVGGGHSCPLWATPEPWQVRKSQ